MINIAISLLLNMIKKIILNLQKYLVYRLSLPIPNPSTCEADVFRFIITSAFRATNRI